MMNIALLINQVEECLFYMFCLQGFIVRICQIDWEKPRANQIETRLPGPPTGR